MTLSSTVSRVLHRSQYFLLALIFAATAALALPPILTPIGDQTVREGNSLIIGLNASDPDGDGVSFSETGLPGFCNPLQDNGNGTASITCNPGAGDDGTYNVTVTVTDDSVAAEQTSEAFDIIVNENTPPVLTPIGNQSMVEGESLNIPLSASDADGDAMSFANTTRPGFCVLNDGNGSGSLVCNPQVGDGGNYNINVIVEDNGPIPESDSDPFTLNVSDNEVPVASNVSISGNAAVGELLTGSYNYSDAEGDLEGASLYQWLRNGNPIGGATGTTYTIVAADVEQSLRFRVTPVAATGASPGTPEQSAEFVVSNSAPTITGQVAIDINEDTSRAITLADITVSDPDSVFPDDFTLIVLDGTNYTRSGPGGNTITPDLDFSGPLTVPIRVNDGFVDSPIFNLLVTVLPVNDAPTFVGVQPPGLSTPEDTTLTIVLDDLIVTDPDNVVPDDLTLTLLPPLGGANYTLAGATSITPAQDFDGQLNVRATVSDLELTTPPFNIPVDVDPVNDLPVLVAPIGAQNAVEASPFVLDVSNNFSDVEGPLTFNATWLPAKPPNINLNSQTGVFSGTPQLVDAEPPGPVYQVTVEATDTDGAMVMDTFTLTIAALGRANLGLTISVTPDSAQPNDELRWTFTTNNPVGPVAGANIELSGSFVGNGLSVGVVGGANCTINAGGNGADFVCTIGGLPVGGTNQVTLTTTASQVTEVVAFATSAGTQTVPIDPNPADNSDTRAVGVAESFAVGAAQILGNSAIRSVDAGDVNGDQIIDLVVGTASGSPVLIYLGDVPRESCQCQRDFLSQPISIPDTGSNRGVALADFNNDGDLDLVVANSGGQADRVYQNDGAGNFTLRDTLELSSAQDVAVGDFNNDGDMDIAIAAASPNPIYFGNGNGTFGSPTLLGDDDSFGVAVGNFDGNNRDDVVFANVGSPSRAYTKNAGGTGFTLRDSINIGDAVSVAAGQLNGDSLDDVVFGRVPTDVGDIPSNPVMYNNGGANFGNPDAFLGISPTNDVLIGDINDDGDRDIVVINASGVHQIWTDTGGGYTLHSEQIIDGGAMAGVIADLGFTDNGDPGGVDLAMGGGQFAGVGVYLNDSEGNLGRGDTVAPVITLNGNASVSTPAGSAYSDAGATAVDNIDGNIAPIPTSNVNTSVTGNYTVTYNVTDFAGNAADPVVRNVTVTPAAGRGGGGGGTLSVWTLAVLLGIFLMVYARAQRQRRPRKIRTSETAKDK